MDGHDTRLGDALDVGANWMRLVGDWIAHSGHSSAVEANSISVEFALVEANRKITVRFMTTTRLLVAFMTDGRSLRVDQLALAAAAANAWNTEQLIPMLSVWDVHGPGPCLAGTCSLPLTCEMPQTAFVELATEWADQAGRMFTRCHQVFRL